MDVLSYIEIVKPKLVFLLAVTSLSAMYISASLNSLPLTASHVILGGITAIAASAGCNAITSYIDRDIDAVMTRTMRRPLPSKKIAPSTKALYYGLVLAGFSLAMAITRNFIAFLCILFGMIDNIVVYSLATKRRSSLNIILGGFSGGLAPLFGWAFIANSIDVTALLLGSIVVLWIPSHIWSLAIYYQSDYEKAQVPMLPVVIGTEKAIKCIVSTMVLLVAGSIALNLFAGFGLIYLTVSVVSDVVVLVGYLYLYIRPSLSLAWKLFKISSPHLLLLFSAMVVDLYIR